MSYQLSSKLQAKASAIRLKVKSVQKLNEGVNVQGNAIVNSDDESDLETVSPNVDDSTETNMA